MLKKTLGVRFDELLTALNETENVCNRRPLTYIYDDNIIKPLWPNHMIHCRAMATIYKDMVSTKEIDVIVESFN